MARVRVTLSRLDTLHYHHAGVNQALVVGTQTVFLEDFTGVPAVAPPSSGLQKGFQLGPIVGLPCLVNLIVALLRNSGLDKG